MTTTTVRKVQIALAAGNLSVQQIADLTGLSRTDVEHIAAEQAQHLDDEPDFDVQLDDRPIPAVLGETEWQQIVAALRTTFDGGDLRLADRLYRDVLTR